MRVIAVIGANFGDEGKGRIVDELASKAEIPAVVVRYNGGAQAGHTVITPENKKHIFHHFCSGTLTGADSWLSDFFIANPFLWVREYKQLKDIGIKPNLFIHPHTPLSTPYDMLINREVEKWRGMSRHGSCGYGIAETVERLCNTPYRTFVKDANTSKFKDMVNDIRDKYSFRRLAELGIQKPSEWFYQSNATDGLLEQYYDELAMLLKAVPQRRTAFLNKYKTIIFEGAQGLCLDERHRFYPNVTRSKTGLTNITKICKKINVGRIEVVYVTRAYLTRHGAGPLPTEDKTLSYKDETNINNEWQGELRSGHLDLDLLAESIKHDIRSTSLKIQPSIAITCFDQVPKQMKVKCKMQITEIDKDALPIMISSITNIQKILISRSRKRRIKKFKK